LNWYVGHVHALCGYNIDVTARFYRVQHMLSAPAALFHPRVALAVLRRHLWSTLAAPPNAWSTLGGGRGA
jgi:hypothetical protein